MIIEHEIRHIKERHFIDLTISRVCCIAMWWNPAVWLLNKEMRAIHEFQADSGVISRGYRINDYQMMLVKKAAGNRMQFVTSSLTNSTLKSRFKMMRQPKAGNLTRIKAVAIFPVMATILMIAGRSEAGATLHRLHSDNRQNNDYPESIFENIADNIQTESHTTSRNDIEQAHIGQAETSNETIDGSLTTTKGYIAEPIAEQKQDATQSDDDIHWAEIISTEVIGNNNTAVYINHTALARQIETEIQTELQSEMAELKKELQQLSQLSGNQYELLVHENPDANYRNTRDEYATDASSQNIKGVYANLNTLNGSTNVTVIIDSDRPITTVGSAMVNIDGKRYPTKVTNVTPLGKASGQYQTKVSLSTKQLDKFSRKDYASLITNRGTVKVKIRY